MDKVKELPKIQENGKKEKLSRDELIKLSEQKIEQLKILYYQEVGRCAGLKETN